MSYEMLKDACLTNAAALYTIESVLLEYIRELKGQLSAWINQKNRIKLYNKHMVKQINHQVTQVCYIFGKT